MNLRPGSNDSLALSYGGLRKAVGVIGTALPLVLALGKMFFESPGIQSSISDYYYTIMRDVLVGSLCAIALFLLFYRAYSWDYVAGCLAGVFALGVALFPTTPDVNVTPRDKFIGILHIICAASFLLTLAFISLVLFRKTDPTRTPTRRKLQRNVIYSVCGYTILACLALIVVVAFLGKDSPVKKLSPVFWLEAVAVVAFGVSWLTKGEALLKDETQT